ncbi:MAG: prepilin-type N-terminal cleavage/methylation domain-containing protein [Pirellulales bacterium]
MSIRHRNTAPGCDRLHSGFTLLELILVLTVIVMASAVVGPRLLPKVGDSALKGAALQFQSDLAELRAAAVESGAPMGCLVWHQRAQYVVGPASELLALAGDPTGITAIGALDSAGTTLSDRPGQSTAATAGPQALKSIPSPPEQTTGPSPTRGFPIAPAIRSVDLPIGLNLVPVVSAGASLPTGSSIDQPLSSDVSTASADGVGYQFAGNSSFQTGSPQPSRQPMLQQTMQPLLQPMLPDSGAGGVAGAAGAVVSTLIVFQPSGRTSDRQLALCDSASGKWLAVRLRGLTGGVTLSAIERFEPSTSGRRASADGSASLNSVPSTGESAAAGNSSSW